MQFVWGGISFDFYRFSLSDGDKGSRLGFVYGFILWGQVKLVLFSCLA